MQVWSYDLEAGKVFGSEDGKAFHLHLNHLAPIAVRLHLLSWGQKNLYRAIRKVIEWKTGGGGRSMNR